MGKLEPEATSTPTPMLRPAARRPIHDKLQFDSPTEQSTISSEESDEDGSREDSANNKSSHYESSREIASSKARENSTSRHCKDSSSNVMGSKCSLISIWCAILIFVLGGGVSFYMGKENKLCGLDDSIKSVQKEFTKQDANFWTYVKVNIKEISILQQPRTIMLIYEEEVEPTLNKILDKISEIAVCHLTNCVNKPVKIEGSYLNKPQFTKDYGQIISYYRKDLANSGVMIVKNLERVPGTAAQAFHSLCDDYNPVEKRALIIFTLKVDKVPDKHLWLKFVEQTLLKLWNDISVDDKFYPLFTRITSTILPVNKE